MIDPREDAQAYIEEHSINKLFQVLMLGTSDDTVMRRSDVTCLVITLLARSEV